MFQECYTRVLKGHIALAQLVFPSVKGFTEFLFVTDIKCHLLTILLVLYDHTKVTQVLLKIT